MIKATLRCGVLAAAFIGTSLQAAMVIVGLPAAPGTGNCDPFGCPAFFGLGTYQQVYASSAFTAPLTISTVTFYDTQVLNSGKAAQGTYTLSFSYTSKAVGMLDLTNPANNIGPGSQTFFSGALPNPAGGGTGTTLVFSGAPFAYDPASGNLLLTMVVSSAANASPPLYLDFANSTAATTNAYFGSTGNGGNTSGGLVTGFASALQITAPVSLAAGAVGVPYGPVTFTAAGGTGGYVWSAAGLPTGLSFSTGGVLSGTPATGSQGSYNPQFTVTDSSLSTATVNLPLLIDSNSGPLQITGPASLAMGATGVAYGPVTFAATGGTGGYGWSATGLPTGLTFSTGGVLGGIPATGSQGGYNPQFTVTDSSSHTASVTLPLVINQEFTTLATFIGTNGATPEGPLVLGADGNFYGTTYYGGATSTQGNGQDAWGAIFRITPSGGFALLYSFTNGTDGSGPAAGLIQSTTDGSFYGTTSGRNGQSGFGTIYKYSPGGSPLTVYTFTGAADGGVPLAGLVQGADGNFYGTTSAGGTNGAGTIFQYHPSAGTLTTLYNFLCPPAGNGCADGRTPLAGLVQGTDGNFYGTTSAGGSNGAGTIFNISLSGAFATLYSFCAAAGCSDGSTPLAGLVQATDGNFYGATQLGGTTNNGTVFKYTPGQGLTTLHSFTGSGPDGGSPAAGLVQGTDGNFYGTTQQGGAGNSGTVFQMTPTGNLSSLPLLGTDGSNPVAALVQCPTSNSSCPAVGVNLYGTAKNGGANGDGTVFSVAFAGPVTYSISGQVTLSGSGLSGVTVTLSGSQSGSVLTNSSGSYSFNAAAGGNYTVTPSLAGYTFAPPSQTFSNLSGNQTQNFVASPVMFTISGQVTLSGSGLSGVTVTLSGSQSGSVITNSSGSYTFNVAAGGNYTVTPSLAGYTFAPPSQSFNNLSGNQTQNFAASPVTYTISGQVTLSGNGLSGVTVTLSGSQSSSVITNGSGSYTFTVAAGGNYTVTPSLAGYTFTPSSQTFNNLSSNQTLNFLASATATLTISGQINFIGDPLAGVTVILSGSQSGGVTTNSSGSYTFNVAAGGNYTVTPSLAGYSFTPTSETFNNLSINQTENFAGSRVIYTISGQVTLSGSGLSGVTVTLSGSQSGIVTTNSSGSYSFGVAAGGNYTVVPSLSGHSFNPASQTFNNLSANQTANFSASSGPASLLFVPLTPCRVVDTRNPTGPFGGPPLKGNSRNFAIPDGACSVPATAMAYSLNVTVIPSGALGYLTIWPTGQPQPVVSTLNSQKGIIKADAALVAAGVNGSVSVYASAATDVVLDINGYFVAGNSAGLSFYPLTPCRAVDTRNAPGPLGGPIMSGGQTRSFPLPSGCSIPASAQAYALNFTVVPSGPLGYLTTWPTGEPQPVVSTLNAPTGLITANAAIVPAGTNGAIDVYTSAPTQVVIDINGYFAPPGGAGALSFYTVSPCRAVNTENANGPLGGPELWGQRDFPLSTSSCGLPATAQAYSLNATVVPLGPLGYLTLWPTGAPQPVVSTLNSPDGSIVSNAAIVPVESGSISAYASYATQLILDTNGYFAP